MKRIYSAQNLAEAYLVRDLLTQAGVAAHVFNEHAMAAMGELAVGAAYPQVWIAQAHQEQHARAVITDYESRPPSTSVRNCMACGEENPGEFEVCWKCATPLGHAI
ncbi:MAG: DUF2007 domain-containing protein [Betaproteobacteria bacterium]